MEAVTRALQLTHEIHDAVRQLDWLRAGELVAERSPLLMTLKPDQSAHVIEMIREIQALDEDITVRARAGVETLTRETAQARQRIRSASQYQAMSRL
jgi:hypothetical protein